MTFHGDVACLDDDDCVCIEVELHTSHGETTFTLVQVL